jgi:hypothetical protein
MINSIALLKSAESGIVTLQNRTYQGFQEGNPLVRQEGIAIHLFSDEGSMEMIFFQKDYKSFTGVTQPEINRIVQSLHKSSPSIPPTATTTNGRSAGARCDATRLSHSSQQGQHRP